MTVIEIEKYLTADELKDEGMTDSMRIKLATHRAAKQTPYKNVVVEQAVQSLPKMSKEESEALRVEAEKKKNLEKRNQLLRRWEIFKYSIPVKFQKAKLEAFKLNGNISPNQTSVLREIFKRELEKKPSNILFKGSSGVGKTHFSVALGIRYIRAGLVVRFIQDKDFVALEPYMQRQYENCPVLILDDIAGDGDYGRIASWESKKIRNLIYDRADKGLKTIISTNFTLKQIEKYLGVRAWSRFTNDFTEGNGFEFIDFGDSAGFRGLV